MAASTLHGDVASAIGQQVEQMIYQAKKDSEARVRHDLTMAKNQLQHMQNMIEDLGERVNRVAKNNGRGASETVDRQFLSDKIAQLEQKWGSEVKALKQDLHRTILAHNHNSDLMRHHRDALDEARKRLDAQTQPKAEQIDQQIEKVDRMLRQGQAKQRALDTLTERLAQLEQQVGQLLPSAAGDFGGMGQMMGQPAPSSRAQKKDEPPTEEEVRAKLLQHAQAARAGQAVAADGASSFNAAAPVFVPRSATAPQEGPATVPSPTAEVPATAMAGAVGQQGGGGAAAARAPGDQQGGQQSGGSSGGKAEDDEDDDEEEEADAVPDGVEALPSPAPGLTPGLAPVPTEAPPPPPPPPPTAAPPPAASAPAGAETAAPEGTEASG